MNKITHITALEQVPQMVQELNQTYYFELNGQTFAIDFYYLLGGYNYYHSEVITRGYYVALTPCNIGKNSRTFRMFSGRCSLLKEVTRKSKKAKNEALQLISLDIIQRLYNQAEFPPKKQQTNSHVA